MCKPELLAPAGDLERLKYAIIYGADAVYIGGKQYSLRSMASNFTLEDIKEGCEFAHAHNAKVYVTCNMVMHESDITNLLGYLKDLEACGVDAIIASSVTILSLVKKETKMEGVSVEQMIAAIDKQMEDLTAYTTAKCAELTKKKYKMEEEIDLQIAAIHESADEQYDKLAEQKRALYKADFIKDLPF